MEIVAILIAGYLVLAWRSSANSTPSRAVAIRSGIPFLGSQQTVIPRRVQTKPIPKPGTPQQPKSGGGGVGGGGQAAQAASGLNQHGISCRCQIGCLVFPNFDKPACSACYCAKPCYNCGQPPPCSGVMAIGAQPTQQSKDVLTSILCAPVSTVNGPSSTVCAPTSCTCSIEGGGGGSTAGCTFCCSAISCGG